MSRFLIIAADGETIAAVLSMDQDDALANVEEGQMLIALDPATDNGASVSSRRLIYDSNAGLLRDTETNLPPASLADVGLSTVNITPTED